MSEEMNEFESVLGAYRPVAPAVNRDALMFETGRARGVSEGKSALWRWRVAAGFLVCTSAVLGILGAEGSRFGAEMHQIGTVVGQKSTEIRAKSAAAAAPPSGLVMPEMTFVRAGGEASYLEVRDRVLLLGMSGLPSVGAGTESAPGVGAVRRSLDIPDAAPAWQRRAAGVFTGDHS